MNNPNNNKKKNRCGSIDTKMVNKLDKDEKKNINNEDIKTKLLNSKIGLINAGGSCYMASIIQILVHLKKFLDIFLQDKYTNNFSFKFYNFIKILSNSKYPLEIDTIAYEYNLINKKFSGEEGNNPMSFFTDFIKELSKENKKIFNIFKGQKVFNFEDVKNYNEDFLFHLIVLDKNNYNITELINNGRIFDGKNKKEKNVMLFEKIIKTPEILIINLETENIEYKGEEYIVIDNSTYELVAVNMYTNYHSIA